MFLFHRPHEEQIRELLEGHRDHSFTYSNSGTIGHAVTPGYNFDHHRVRLGDGPAIFANGIEAIRRWEMFNMNWLKLCWPDVPIAAGSMVAVLAHHLGFWSLNLCRIARVIDEEQRYGFVYGTLADHAERGQEQFVVKWEKDDSVWYEIEAVSKPNQLLARIGYPIARILQKRFARDSMAAMVRAVKAGASDPFQA